MAIMKETTCFGEYIEIWEPLHLAGEDALWNSLAATQSFKHAVTTWPSNSTYKEVKSTQGNLNNSVQTEVFMWIFITLLIIIAKNMDQLKCSLPDS